MSTGLGRSLPTLSAGAFRVVMIGLSASVALAAAALLVSQVTDDDAAVDLPDTSGQAISVNEALGLPENVLRAVAGFVFEDEIGLRLCHGRVHEPEFACLGPFLELRGFDLASVPADSTETSRGTVFHSRDQVVLIGALYLTQFTVEDIVAEPS